MSSRFTPDSLIPCPTSASFLQHFQDSSWFSETVNLLIEKNTPLHPMPENYRPTFWRWRWFPYYLSWCSYITVALLCAVTAKFLRDRPLFIHLCKHFFQICKQIVLNIACLQAIYFVFVGPANNFFQYFLYPLPSRKIMVHPQQELDIMTFWGSNFRRSLIVGRIV